MKRLRNLIISAITISSVFIPSEISKAEEKIEIIPLIQSTKGLEVIRSPILDGSKLSLGFLK